MKITEYPKVTDLVDDNVFLLDGPSGTKTLTRKDFIYSLLDGVPEMHRNIFRGKNLGATYTADQKAAVYNGTFHDIWVGDYWEVDGHKWRIVDINYFRRSEHFTDSGPASDNHLTLMADDVVYNLDKVADENTKPAYVNTKAYSTGRDEYYNTLVPDIFRADEALRYDQADIICIAIGNNGEAKTWQLESSPIENPTHMQMFGSMNPYTLNVRDQIPQNQTNGYMTQFALMRLAPKFIYVPSSAGASAQGTILRDPVGFGPASTGLISSITATSSGGSSTVMTNVLYMNADFSTRPYFSIAGVAQ